MNRVSQETENRNPWEAREKLPSVPVRRTAITAAVCFLCALGLPFCDYAAVALGLLAVLFAYVVYTARSPFPVVFILTTAFLVVTLTADFTLGAMLLALVVGTCAGAYLFTVLKRSYVFALITVLAAAVVYAVTRDLRSAMLSLCFLPSAVLLAIATLLGKRRTTAICFAVAGLLLSLVVGVGLAVRDAAGSLNADTVREYFNALRDQIIASLNATVAPMLEQMEALAVDEQSQAVYEMFYSMYGPDGMTSFAKQLFNVLPALTVIVCMILGFEAQLLLNASYRTSGLSMVLTKDARVFTMSVTASLIYAVSFFLKLLIPVGESLAGAVIQNICLILLPGLCIIGIQHLLFALVGMRGRSGFFFVFILAVIACCLFSGNAIYVLGMWGAYGVITVALHRKLMGQIRKDGNDRDSQSGD